MTIKKDYVEIINFLEVNKDKKVETILDELKELCSRQVTTTFRKDDDGNVTHVFCYYHKVWESVTEHEYGKKASNKATGLNTMCKVGTNLWYKQQRDFKKVESDLLKQLLSNSITKEELEIKLEEAKQQRDAIN